MNDAASDIENQSTARDYKVLILGAGASMPYGFPSGAMLRQKILSIDEATANHAGLIAEDYCDPTNSLSDFKEAFRLSQKTSIDSFLGTRTEFTEIGKKCIAIALLQCEIEEVLFNDAENEDHWYQYLVNEITNNEWEALDFSDLAIVTFNYDRSLQYFLYTTLQYTYGKSGDEVVEKLRKLRIVNVYGSLCDKYPGERGWIKYGGEVNWRTVQSAASSLIVIPEGRTQSDSLIQARTLIKGAKKIAFLGFGFDRINVARLSEDSAFRPTIQHPNRTRTRHISGTAKGMTHMELQRACKQMRRGDSSTGSVTAQNFHNMGCTEYLRHTLFLDT